MGLSLRQCRLNPEQRRMAYDVFSTFRVRATLSLSYVLKTNQRNFDTLSELYQSRLYVDEVQELRLHFSHLVPTKWFVLAGDPAQSFDEGIDFWF